MAELSRPVKKPRLDLDAMPETSGMSETQHNDNRKLPINRKTISLSHAPSIVQGIQLLPLTIMPHRFQSIFKYPNFNAVQSKCFPAVYGGDDNIVLSSPTGSGKTAIMEMAICRLVQNFEHRTYKIVYQAPTKALCSERKKDWEIKFRSLDLKCEEVTGDTDRDILPKVQSSDIIITTPEKWDSMTRRWHDHKRLFELVKLFLVSPVITFSKYY